MEGWHKNLVVFELANNHQGNLDHARYIIKKLGAVAHKFSINAAVKFQYRDLNSLIHPAFINRTDVKHIPRFLSTSLTSEEFYELVLCVREHGLHTMCTPFDEKSVEVCLEHGIEILKVASCSATDWPLLECVVKAEKPIILSTGGTTYSEIDNIYNFLTHRSADFALLHCVGLYPVDDEHVQLSCIDRMIGRYRGIPIGYSGHEDPKDLSIVKMAIAKGASIVERHVGHATDVVKLNAYSTEVDEIEDWVQAICSALTICQGFEEKQVSAEERASLDELARGCFAARDIGKGGSIERQDVFFAIPRQEGQTTSGEYSSDMVADRSYQANAPLYEKRPASSVVEIRSIVHDIKALLLEAKIYVGKEFELELSHHYGKKRFREIGAAIINIVNREYCKKLIILLPGQCHPMHYHKIKEETFQVLCGVLDLDYDGMHVVLEAGDVFTVERSFLHSFSSEQGCVFEEISTTHMKNDSVYTDDRINRSDLIERKTVLKEW
jgi:N-acetylneuraminate synthase